MQDERLHEARNRIKRKDVDSGSIFKMPTTVQNFGQKKRELGRRKMTVASNSDGFSRK